MRQGSARYTQTAIRRNTIELWVIRRKLTIPLQKMTLTVDCMCGANVRAGGVVTSLLCMMMAAGMRTD